MTIGENRILRVLGFFVWISGLSVIQVEGDYLQTGPLDVLEAYVNRYPSTIQNTFQLDVDHDRQWIFDEMERRLWLCGKWLALRGSTGTDAKRALEEAIGNMAVFLEYRERYFGMKAYEEKQHLNNDLEERDKNDLVAKLREYQHWCDDSRDLWIKQRHLRSS